MGLYACLNGCVAYNVLIGIPSIKLQNYILSKQSINKLIIPSTEFFVNTFSTLTNRKRMHSITFHQPLDNSSFTICTPPLAYQSELPSNSSFSCWQYFLFDTWHFWMLVLLVKTDTPIQTHTHTLFLSH